MWPLHARFKGIWSSEKRHTLKTLVYLHLHSWRQACDLFKNRHVNANSTYLSAIPALWKLWMALVVQQNLEETAHTPLLQITMWSSAYKMLSGVISQPGKHYLR